MGTMRWHRFVILVGPGVWSVVRRMQGLLGWISRVSPELRLERRSGRLRGDVRLRQQLADVLRPLDILVERGPLRVSDGLIPGYFKHAAVFLGRELAVLVRETAAAHGPLAVSRSRADSAVLEATRNGVRLVSLDDVLDVDSLAVLRPAQACPEEFARVVSRAARELGKEYDYCFDVNDQHKQFCCKLVSCLFPGLTSADFLGAGTAMIPDDFVRPALAGAPGAPRLSLLVHQGLPVEESLMAGVLAGLLRDGFHRGSCGHGSERLQRLAPG